MGPKTKGAKKKKLEEESKGSEEQEEIGGQESDGVEEKRRKKKGQKRGQHKYIGAHVSISGGIWKAVDDCVAMGGRSFALFLGSQRSWQRPPLNSAAAEKFQKACSENGFDPVHILPHGSYLMNCGSPKQDVFEKSQALLVDELCRCTALGLCHFNLHPGASLGSITTEQLLENMCGQGSTVGGQFSELRGIIDRVRDQSRVGVCLDTCHAFAAGYDLSAAGGVKSVLDEFDQVVGLSYLRAVHLNDSKGKLGCHLDRHEDVGRGQIGLQAFRDIVNEPRLDNIPLILETPGRPGFEYPEQIELLYSLCKD
ncbi:hypothetical protein JZ751_025261 [Albula glossodonta]|uniref:Xylose isomerase-like TIM barrel domain-containing protein n=1 Tax=Albula glossodonta TaxID=121402 RepID=A0A8T2NFP0_9TELE|nr:hypothetical protein JZ751_025261 [Albula glossodonta]